LERDISNETEGKPTGGQDGCDVEIVTVGQGVDLGAVGVVTVGIVGG
jgi:hypothetical protein